VEGLRTCPADTDPSARGHGAGPGVAVHVADQGSCALHAFVDLLGDTAEELVLEDVVLLLAQQSTLFLDPVGDGAGECGDGVTAVLGVDEDGDDPGGADLVVDAVAFGVAAHGGLEGAQGVGPARGRALEVVLGGLGDASAGVGERWRQCFATVGQGVVDLGRAAGEPRVGCCFRGGPGGAVAPGGGEFDAHDGAY